MRRSPRLRSSLGCLLSQLSLGFKFDQVHKIFNDQIALEFFAFLFGKRTVTFSVDEIVCSFSYLGRGMESHDLFRSWMIREKLCNFSSGLCFEKHSHFLLLLYYSHELYYNTPARGELIIGSIPPSPTCLFAHSLQNTLSAMLSVK